MFIPYNVEYKVTDTVIVQQCNILNLLPESFSFVYIFCVIATSAYFMGICLRVCAYVRVHARACVCVYVCFVSYSNQWVVPGPLHGVQQYVLKG